VSKVGAVGIAGAVIDGMEGTTPYEMVGAAPKVTVGAISVNALMAGEVGSVRLRADGAVGAAYVIVGTVGTAGIDGSAPNEGSTHVTLIVGGLYR